MCKKLRASFSLEASFIMPIVLFLYLLIILAALFLYCRCVISQDVFLLCMRGERFTYGEENYGEVIYGTEESSLENYIQERLIYKRNTYPAYSFSGEVLRMNEDLVLIQVKQKGSLIPMKKQVKKINPVKLIREGRKS